MRTFLPSSYPRSLRAALERFDYSPPGRIDTEEADVPNLPRLLRVGGERPGEEAEGEDRGER
jgi:hypothetical protein